MSWHFHLLTTNPANELLPILCQGHGLPTMFWDRELPAANPTNKYSHSKLSTNLFIKLNKESGLVLVAVKKQRCNDPKGSDYQSSF